MWDDMPGYAYVLYCGLFKPHVRGKFFYVLCGLFRPCARGLFGYRVYPLCGLFRSYARGIFLVLCVSTAWPVQAMC